MAQYCKKVMDEYDEVVRKKEKAKEKKGRSEN